MHWAAAMAVGAFAGAAIAALVSRHVVRVLVSRARHAERQARANERMAEIGAMTSGLTHEIKNPLSTIGLNAQLLSEGIGELPVGSACDPEVKARLTRRVDALRREVERLRGILSDFLSYAGEVRIAAQPTDVATIVQELGDFFAPQALQQRVQLRVDTPRDGAPVVAMVDGPQLKQALLNLMLNAVQAMGPVSASGGTIGAVGATGKARELILRVARVPSESGARGVQGPDLVAVHVIDTGPGIAPEAIERIFQPYYTTKAGGSGLGLAITRRIIEAHGGRIQVHSQVGQGSDFVCVVPGATAVGAAVG